MSRKRGQLDPFIQSSQPRWLVVSVTGGGAVSVTLLPPRTDLKHAFLCAVDDHRRQGWLIENESSYPCVFARRGVERRMLTISHSDPAGPALAHFSPWRD